MNAAIGEMRGESTSSKRLTAKWSSASQGGTTLCRYGSGRQNAGEMMDMMVDK